MFSTAKKYWIRVKLALVHKENIGKNIQLIAPRLISCPKGSLFVGKDFFAGPSLYISMNSYCKLEIYDAVMFGPDVMVLGGNHKFAFVADHLRYCSLDDEASKDIKVESGVWLGARSLLLSGANIGEGSIIGACSLVNKRVPPYTISAGVPVKALRPRFSSTADLVEVLRVTESTYTLPMVLEQYERAGISMPN